VAIVTKTHEAMVDEHSGIDLSQVILDAAPEPRRTVGAIWMPQPEPGAVQLVRDAVFDLVRRPAGIGDTVREAKHDLRTSVGRLGALTGGLASAAGALARRQPSSRLSARLSEQRRIAIARTRLSDYRAVRDAFGGTVNDVVLAVVAGALRGWLLARAEPLRPATTIRVLLPMSVLDPAEQGPGANHPSRQHHTGPLAAHVRPMLLDLPVGEADPALRLAQLRYAMASHGASERAVRADRLAGLSGFAPPTLHAISARTAAGLARRMFSLVVTNVPGPQLPLYAAGSRMTEMFPILPLSEGHALSFALTSYDGGLYYGITADRDAVPDVASLGELVEESLAELVAAAGTDAINSAGDQTRGVGRPARPGTAGRQPARRGANRRPPSRTDNR
jgi:WS/DGAT/MGAT family acyltransferase